MNDMADLNANIDPKLDDTTEDTLELDDLDTVSGGIAKAEIAKPEIFHEK